MSTISEPRPQTRSYRAEEEVTLQLVQAATATFTIEDLQAQRATAPVAPQSDWERFLQFEARRRGISIAIVQQENEAAETALSRIKLDADKLREAARNSSLDHPYLLDDDEPSPFE